ncbi:MAG: two-component sensor histidine kinase [Dehalococcoidia bacterium]|nr:MAG: two-component sensor histidine kinase [Dehalococcoidia bacterium]
MSIRLRLTFWYVGLLAIMLALFSSFIYVLFERNLTEEIDNSLYARADEMIRVLSASGPLLISPRIPATVDAFASGEFFIQLISADGDLLDRSSNLMSQRIPSDPAVLTRIVREGRAGYDTMRAERHELRVYTIPLVSGGQVIGFLQIARSMEDLKATMVRLRQVLFVGSGFILIVAFLTGSLIARRALMPIDRITQTARRIGVSGNLTERVRVRGPQDEIGRLANTFNWMLDRLEQAYSRLEQALAAQRRFVADASHELRTPLTTVLGNLDFLTRHGNLQDPDLREALADANSEAQRMSRLVEDLLFLARADAGQRLQMTTVRADETVRDVIRQARRLANGQTIEAGPIVPATIVASPDHFKQLLLVLVDNAIKYTPAGGTITISAVVTGDPPELAIEIADTGPGIHPDDLPHIFERFYRAEQARGGSGSGLGLAIARWLADEHDGRIDVRSSVGHGSVFTVRLPVLSTPDVSPLLPATSAA